MAQFSQFAPKILRIEGGYTVDSGGATYKGIRLDMWKKYIPDRNQNGTIDIADLRKLSDAEVLNIYEKEYWNALLAGSIRNQSIAELLVDFKINGGLTTGRIKGIQKRVGASMNGLWNMETVRAINAYPIQKELFTWLMVQRKAYYAQLITDNPKKYKENEKGWGIRLKNFEFIPNGLGIGVAIATVAMVGDLVIRQEKSLPAQIFRYVQTRI